MSVSCQYDISNEMFVDRYGSPLSIRLSSSAIARRRNYPTTLQRRRWAHVAIPGGHGYLLADNADLKGRQCWLRAVTPHDLAEYRDFGGGVYRAAAFVGDRIEAWLFIGPAQDAGDWNVIKPLFAADALSDEQRRVLLSGKSIECMVSAGPIVCACFGVGRTTICDAIAAGAGSAAEIGAAEGRHQLRLMDSGDEAADRADGRDGFEAAPVGSR
jgi:hypothetical protein